VVRHVISLRHIILIPSQPDFALTMYSFMLLFSGEPEKQLSSLWSIIHVLQTNCFNTQRIGASEKKYYIFNIGWKNKILSFVKNGDNYIITLCILLKAIFLRNSLEKKPPIKIKQ
jgi:hypothetical protein